MKSSGNVYIINISIPKPMLGEMDGWAATAGYNRSEFIRKAVRNYIRSLRRKKW